MQCVYISDEPRRQSRDDYEGYDEHVMFGYCSVAPILPRFGKGHNQRLTIHRCDTNRNNITEKKIFVEYAITAKT